MKNINEAFMRFVFLLAFIGTTSTTLAVTPTQVGFDNGDSEGFTGNAFYESSGGNPGGNAHFFVQAFGVSLRTGGIGEPTNDGFVGDYTQFPQVSISFDVQVDSITNFFGGQIPAAIGISIIDHDTQGPSGAAGVFFEMGVISAATNSQWTTLSTIISDTNALDLPPGWIGFGDEDPNTFEPTLPDGATFASVLAGADEFQITTFVPGFFFTNSNYDLRIDNVTLAPVPLPGALWLFAGAALSLLGLRRN